MKSSIKITPLSKEEFGGLYEFMRPLWYETYSSFLPACQIDLLLNKYFSPTNLQKFLNEGYEYYSVNGEGVLVVQPRKVGLYVDKLYILPKARGKNYPKFVFEFLITRGQDLYLNVNVNNARAVNCYLKNGFEIEKREDIDLGNGLVNCDFVMRKKVGSYESVRIKKCSLSDLPTLPVFYSEVLEHLVRTVNYPRWTPGVYPCEESIKEAIKKGYQFCANMGDNIVGAFIYNEETGGDYTVGEWKKQLKQGEFAIIHTLATHQNHYGKGVAKQMVQYCVNLAKMQGYKALRLDVVPDNFPAIKLYEAQGFTFAGEKDLNRGFKHIPTFCLYELNF